MQFLPATWKAYGMGGDIDDPRDAILAAANYLHRRVPREDLDGALFAYNPSTSYVRAIRRFARRMRSDDRAFLDLLRVAGLRAHAGRRQAPDGTGQKR